MPLSRVALFAETARFVPELRLFSKRRFGNRLAFSDGLSHISSRGVRNICSEASNPHTQHEGAVFRFRKRIAGNPWVTCYSFAETRGFEPSRAFTLLAFQASALDHYATLPCALGIIACCGLRCKVKLTRLNLSCRGVSSVVP